MNDAPALFEFAEDERKFAFWTVGASLDGPRSENHGANARMTGLPHLDRHRPPTLSMLRARRPAYFKEPLS